MMRRVVSAGAGRAGLVQRRLVRCQDGVTDDDRRWWEWHIPVRPHKGSKTTVLYLDGVGRYTWKKLIEHNCFTVDHLANLEDSQMKVLQGQGCTNLNVAREHARVFMKLMQDRSSSLSAAQLSWQAEADRILNMRE
eukprot:Hpha_TRINITY_DN15918_c2_g5::TRINITY_DN15918_c2_g5_i1::g.72212::m.72212